MNKMLQISSGSGPRKIIKFAKKTNIKPGPSFKSDHNYTSKMDLTKKGTNTTGSGRQASLQVSQNNVKTEETVVKIKVESTDSSPNLCRTCLQPGDIPIYGNHSHNDISEELKTIGGLNIKKDDAFPKYLCHNCHCMLLGAIQLRITAQYSEQVLLVQAGGTNEDNMDFDEQESDNKNTVLEKIQPDMLKKSNPSLTELQYSSNKEKLNSEKIKSVCQSINIPLDLQITIVSKGNLHTDKKTDVADMADKEHNVTIKHLAAKTLNGQVSATVTNMPSFDVDVKNDTNPSNIIQNFVANTSRARKPISKVKEFKPIKITPETDKIKIIKFKEFPQCAKQAIAQNESDIVIKSSSPIRKLKYSQKKPIIIQSSQKIIRFTADTQRQRKNQLDGLVLRKPVIVPGAQNYCQRCKIFFETMEDLLSHKGSLEHKYFKEACPTCQKLVPAKSMNYHMGIHSNNVIRICHICGVEFNNVSAYMNHKIKHHTSLSLKCSFCPYRCKDGHTLNKHTRTHTGEKPYQCSQCAKQFATSSNMHRHIQTNHKTRDITCNICNARFWRKKDMELHIKKVHYGERPHRCDLCWKCFGERKTLNKHQRQVHKREKCAHHVTPLYLRPEFQTIVQDASAVQGGGPLPCQ